MSRPRAPSARERRSVRLMTASNAVYDRALREGCTPHDRVLWSDAAKQFHRFNEILRAIGDIDRPSLSVLDLGCGNGEFLKMLNLAGFRGRYRGVDVNAGLVAEARERFSSHDFRHGSITAAGRRRFDAVVMSGVFNIDVGQRIDDVADMISDAAAMAREKVVFNAISSHVKRRDRGFFYLSPETAIAIALRHSQRFELRHGFVPFNYTLSIHLVDTWQSLPWR